MLVSWFTKHVFPFIQIQVCNSFSIDVTVANQSSNTTWNCAVIAPVSGFNTSGTMLACFVELPMWDVHWEQGRHPTW
jgi:hypothetical protein